MPYASDMQTPYSKTQPRNFGQPPPSPYQSDASPLVTHRRVIPITPKSSAPKPVRWRDITGLASPVHVANPRSKSGSKDDSGELRFSLPLPNSVTKKIPTTTKTSATSPSPKTTHKTTPKTTTKPTTKTTAPSSSSPHAPPRAMSQPVSSSVMYTPEPTKLVKPLQSAFMSTGLISKRNRPRPVHPHSASALTTHRDLSSSFHQPDTPCKRGPGASFIVPPLPSTPIAFALPSPSAKRPVPSPSPSRGSGPNKRHINDLRVPAKPNLSLASLNDVVPESPEPPVRNWNHDISKLDFSREIISSAPLGGGGLRSPASLFGPLTPTADGNPFTLRQRASRSPPAGGLMATPNDWRERQGSPRASSSMSDSEVDESMMLAADSSDSDVEDMGYRPARRGIGIFSPDREEDNLRSRKDSGVGVGNMARRAARVMSPPPRPPPSPAPNVRRRVASSGSMRSRSRETYITSYVRFLGPDYFGVHRDENLVPTFASHSRQIIPKTPVRSSASPCPPFADGSTESYFESAFTNLAQLGAGEFSTVSKVRDVATGEIYAVKRMLNPYAGFRDRLRQLEEVEVMWALGRNSHVIELIAAWEQRGHLYLQTELCEGGTLAGALDLAGDSGVGEPIVWRCLAEIAQGLSHIHGRGILHLDLKPANIFVTSSGSLKIGDFGLATRVPVPPGTEREGDREYMAQEVLSEARLTPAADMFALGLIVLEMAANIVLPDNGPDWQSLRAGDLGGVAFEGVSESLVGHISEMLRPEWEARPKVNEILEWTEVRRAMEGGRTALGEFMGLNKVGKGWERDRKWPMAQKMKTRGWEDEVME